MCEKKGDAVMKVKDLKDWAEMDIELSDGLLVEMSESHPEWWLVSSEDEEDIVINTERSPGESLWIYLVLDKISPLTKEEVVENKLPPIRLCFKRYVDEKRRYNPSRLKLVEMAGFFDTIEVTGVKIFDHYRYHISPRYFKRTKKNKIKEISYEKFLKRKMSSIMFTDASNFAANYNDTSYIESSADWSFSKLCLKRAALFSLDKEAISRKLKEVFGVKGIESIG